MTSAAAVGPPHSSCSSPSTPSPWSAGCRSTPTAPSGSIPSRLRRRARAEIQTTRFSTRARRHKRRNQGAIPMRRLSLLATLLLAAPAAAQKLPSGDEMIEGYLKNQVNEISKRFLAGAATLGEWEAKRPQLKAEYFEML